MSEYTTREILDMIEANGGPEGLDLSGKDLSGIDLSRDTLRAEWEGIRSTDAEPVPKWWCQATEGVDLQGADLFHTRLANADLSCANLQGAELRYAFLQGSRLTDANLRQAWLEKANLSGAILSRADLQEADMLDVDLQDANLSNTNMRAAALQRANLQAAYVHEVDLEKAHLSKAKLTEATLRNVNLQEAHLGMANLEGASLAQVNLGGANIWDANLQALLRETNLEMANLADASLEGACLWGGSLRGANLVRAQLCHVDFRDVKGMEGLHLHRARLDHTQLTKDQLGGAIGEELEGEWSRAKEAYLGLKNNFEQIGRYDDASWAYRKERRMEKREAWRLAKGAFQEHDWRTVLRKTFKVVGDLIVELTCDYGEGIWQVIRAMVLVWFVFAVIYGAIWGILGPEQWVGTQLRRMPTRHPVDLLLFSIGVTSRMPAGLKAQPTLAMRILMAIEALLGTVLAGLLGFVLGNRIRRS